MREEFIKKTCEKYNLDIPKQERLIAAWREIENTPKALERFNMLVEELCSVREDGGFGREIDFPFESKYPDCTKFLLLLACVEVSKQELINRQIPQELYEKVPGYRIQPQIRQYQETGNCEVQDFPWDRNFYTHSIYLLDRFYFIPCRFDDPFRLYRNVDTGEVVGIYQGGYNVGKDGQLILDDNSTQEVDFQTVFMENDKEIIGNYMNPCGFLSKEIKRLPKEKWKEVLKQGDTMLAFHIPSGEGYNPFHLQKSMQMALDFFEKYFPELPFKGFWSESWLYDHRLSFLLPENGNIVSVQRRFYNYTIGGDGGMLKKEVFGGADADLTKVQIKTSLQEKVLAAIKAGNHFCRTSMIVLPEEVAGIEEAYPYIKESDLEELERVVHTNWIEC